MAGRYDLRIQQGDEFKTKPMRWTYQGNPVDLTSLTPLCQIRLSPGGGVVATVTVTKINAADGIYDLSTTGAVTAAIPVDADTPYDKTNYYYDLQWTGWSVQSPYTLLVGTAEVIPEVSR